MKEMASVDTSASADSDEEIVDSEEEEILVDEEIANREDVIPKDHLEPLMVLFSRI